MKRKIIVLTEAAFDIELAIDFYERIEPGVGSYFRDSLIADLRSLELYEGTHPVHFASHRALCARFPFGIFYRDIADRREVMAILDLRRAPHWLQRQLKIRLQPR